MSLQDGDPIYGVPGAATIAAVALVLENVQRTAGGGRSETLDANNEPNSQYFYNTQITATATAQIESAADIETLQDARNKQAGVFAYTMGGTSKNFVLTECSDAYAQGQAVKCNIGFTEAIAVTPTP